MVPEDVVVLVAVVVLVVLVIVTNMSKLSCVFKLIGRGSRKFKMALTRVRMKKKDLSTV